MVTRIRELLDIRQLSPTQFADLIGVGRPVISHILSERNKPSLEVVQKVISAFPELSLAWLLSGTGSMVAAEAPTGPAAGPQTASVLTPLIEAPVPVAPLTAIAPPVAAITPTRLQEPALVAGSSPLATREAVAAAQSITRPLLPKFRPTKATANPVPAAIVPEATLPLPTPALAEPAATIASTATTVPIPAVAVAAVPPEVVMPKSFVAPTPPSASQPTQAPAVKYAATDPVSAPQLLAAPLHPSTTAAPSYVPSVAAGSGSLPSTDWAAPATVETTTSPAANPAAALSFLGEPGKAIRRIVIFYRDGSFSDYVPEGQ